jgi:hypothetical protein
MKFGQKHRMWLFALILLVAGLAASGILTVAKKQSNKKPQISSKVPNLEILDSRIIDPDTVGAALAVEVRNNSALAIMAIDLVCGEGAVTKNGLTDEENPIVVIPPNGTANLQIGFGEMTPDSPCIVSAVTYADGSEEGDAESLKVMHKVRERDRAIIKERKQQEDKHLEK